MPQPIPDDSFNFTSGSYNATEFNNKNHTDTDNPTKAAAIEAEVDKINSIFINSNIRAVTLSSFLNHNGCVYKISVKNTHL